jgi:NAD(P)H-dependent FMN reductase
MITVICGTHRPKNQTLSVVNRYVEILKMMGEEVAVLQMDELPEDFMISNTFGKRTHGLEAIIHEKIVAAERFVIITPEYNGSYPGLFKAFLDAVKPKVWKGKKVALVGVASGRAGNLRGMDHLTDVMHHLRAEVFSFKVPISKLDTLIDKEGLVIDTATIETLEQQASEFLKY